MLPWSDLLGLRMINCLLFHLCWNIPTIVPLKAEFPLFSEKKKPRKTFPLLIILSISKRGTSSELIFYFRPQSRIPKSSDASGTTSLILLGRKQITQAVDLFCSISARVFCRTRQSRKGGEAGMTVNKYPLLRYPSFLSQELAVTTGQSGFFQGSPNFGQIQLSVMVTNGSIFWLLL